ncbi:hypothetical protein VF12_40690 [Nostoc linckia z15]|nr:hypothetical protein VF12_40690 [Nostoc linckia z15]
MNKSDKRTQLTKMIAEFFLATDLHLLTKLRNKIYNEICQLPMSPSDKNSLEEEMYLWNYNSDQYIENIKNNSYKTTASSDFDKMLKKVDISLLSN